MSQSSLLDIKSKLLKAKDEKKNETLIELLYSLRVHGLQIPSEQRKKFVNELIKNDIFYLTDSKEKGFIINLLTISSSVNEILPHDGFITLLNDKLDF